MENIIKNKEYNNSHNKENLPLEKQEVYESLIEGISSIEDQNNKAFDNANTEIGLLLEETKVPKDISTKIQGINDKLRKDILGNSLNGSRIKRLFLGVSMSLLSQIPSFGTNIDYEKLTSKNPIKTSFDKSTLAEKPDSKTDIFYGDPIGKSSTKKKIEESGNLEKNRLKFKTNFEMGSAEMSQITIDSFKKEISNFIEKFSDEYLEKIKKGRMLVKIPVGSSDDIVRGVQETLGKKYTNNYQLSQIRGEAMKNLVLEVFSKKGIHNPLLIVDIPNVKGKERGVSDNGERFAGVEIVELSYENMVKNYDTIIIDPSGSMNNDREEINKFKGFKAHIVNLDVQREHGDMRELIYKSINKAVVNAENGSKIIFITDEGDNSSFDLNKIKNLREIAKDKNIDVTGVMINPENPNEKVIFDYLNMAYAIRDKGGKNGDIKAFNLVKRILKIRENKS